MERHGRRRQGPCNGKKNRKLAARGFREEVKMELDRWLLVGK